MWIDPFKHCGFGSWTLCIQIYFVLICLDIMLFAHSRVCTLREKVYTRIVVIGFYSTQGWNAQTKTISFETHFLQCLHRDDVHC